MSLVRLAHTAPDADRLGELFNPRALEALFLRLIDGASRRATLAPRVERCWPDGDGRLRFEWTVRGPRSTRQSVFGVPLGQPSQPVDQPGRMAGGLIRGLCFWSRPFKLLLHGADTDPRLPQLAACLDPATVGSTLARHQVVAASPRATVRCRLLGHKPGRRATIAYDIRAAGRNLPIVGKIYRDDGGERLREWHAAVGTQLRRLSDGRVDVPSPLGYAPELKLLLLTWAAGRAARDDAVMTLAQMRQAVYVLAMLHRVRLAELPRFDADDECTITGRWVSALRLAAPERAAEGARLAKLLRAWRRRLAPVALRTIHRDFYEKQLIWRGARGTLLDLDTLAVGDPALDLGNFIAHLYLHRARAGAALDALPALAAQLLEAYREFGGKIVPDDLGFYWAASLVRLGAIHALRDATRPFAAGMWQLAARLLAGEIRLAPVRRATAMRGGSGRRPGYAARQPHSRGALARVRLGDLP